LDTSKPLKMLKPDQITERLLDQVKKHNAKVWVGELKDLTLANQLKLDTNHPIKITFNGSALAHVEKQHGIHSIHYLKNKQPPIGIQDIRDYPKVINEADIHQLTRDKHNQLMLTSAKQINGYFVVVESISTKHNELKLKTLYKENGKLENNPLFSGVNMRTTQVAETSLSPKPSVSHALTHTKEDITTPALKNQDELAPEVQELLAKDKIKWYYKKAINKHLGLENGDYIPNLSPDVKNILKHSYDQDSLSISKKAKIKDIAIDDPENVAKTLPYFKTTLENPDFLLQNLRGELSFLKKIDTDHYAVVKWDRYINGFDHTQDTQYWRLELWDKQFMQGQLKYTNSTDPIDLEKGFVSKQIHNGQLGFSKEELAKWRLEKIKRDNAEIRESILKELAKQEAKKKRELNKSLYTQWKNAFNLKNTNEPFIPKFAPEVKQALESVLQNEEIKLTQGSLYKLVKRDRSGLIDYIRPTLENPNMVLDDGKGLLFIKEFIDPDKNRYFMSVAKNYNGEWIFSTHTRKALSAIKNKVNNSKILYNAGFKSGEVASASDILRSGGTAMKPSDLQINTPPHPSSGLNPEKKISQESLKDQEQQKPKLSKEAAIDEATKDIDPKYLPENFGWRHFSKLRFYELWGKEGLNLKPSEAFYKPKFSPKVQRALEPLGYNIQFSQREIHNWGKSNLKEFKRALENPNVIIELDAGNSKFLTFIQKTPRGIERFSIEPTHEGFNLYDHLGRKFNLKETLQDERINLIFSNDPELTTLRPFNKAFGTNFEEFYHDPKGAIAKLIEAKEGQVAGAFYREDLGDIDLVWGEGGAKGYGLNKILKKHLNDFIWFKGHTPKQKLASALEEIVQKGNLITDQAGIKTIWLKHEDEYYLVGLSKGWKGEGDNHWIITSYKKTHGEIPKEVKGNTANLSAYSDKFNPVLTSTDEPLTASNLIQNNIKNQEIPFEQLNQRMIKPEEFTDSVVKELKKRPKL
ncbi:PBECR2 nuclease fold domain-containing protein, partial [Helicobacter suis]|uniref:putative barnase/colicin E5 family endoribonuclease n=1 Tax=Helicobacter suis TaxID=104628 RepID=UPI0023DD850A